VNQDFWDEHSAKIRCSARETPGFLYASKQAGRPQRRVVIWGMPCVKAVVKVQVLPRVPWKAPSQQ